MSTIIHIENLVRDLRCNLNGAMLNIKIRTTTTDKITFLIFLHTHIVKF